MSSLPVRPAFFLLTLLVAGHLAAQNASNSPAAASSPKAKTPDFIPPHPDDSAAARVVDPEHPVSSVPGETKARRDARMGWWRDAKFGMFIHWGVYSVPAGYYLSLIHI